MQIAVVLGLLIVALILFAMEVSSVDIITMLLLIVLAISGILTPSGSFAGFSNEIIVILASIFVLSGALQKTGVVDAIGSYLHRIAGSSSNRLILAVMTTVGSVSAFMNNTTATAVFLPPIMGLSRKARISPSKLLMPMAFASILGGTCTLIGTSTNVAVSGYFAKSGMKPISLFEITPVGLVLLLFGIFYMVLLGGRLLPAHKGESQTEDYGMRRYLSEIVMLPDSPLLGQKIFESELSRLGFRILQVLRGNDKLLPDPMTAIQREDILLVEGRIEDLMKVKDMAGVEIKALLNPQDSDLQSEENRIAEALLMPQSNLIDRTLKEVNFRQRYGLAALAIYRHGHSLCDKVGHIRLRVGDVLLLHGQAERMQNLRRNPDLTVLEELTPPQARQNRGIFALIFFPRDPYRRGRLGSALHILSGRWRADDADALHHGGRSLPIHRLETADPDRRYDNLWYGNGKNGHSRLPCWPYHRSARTIRRDDHSCGFLSSYNCSDPADVERRGSIGGSSRCVGYRSSPGCQ